MADEITVIASIRVLKGNLQYNTQPESFQADMSLANGPSPGSILVTVAGVDVDFSQLIQPGMCRLRHLGSDDNNWITYGTWDGEFHPFGELLAGEHNVFRISRVLGFEYGTGSGTSGSGNTLRLRAAAGNTYCSVECFDT